MRSGGTGEQTRTVLCKTKALGTVIADEDCPGPKLPTSQACQADIACSSTGAPGNAEEEEEATFLGSAALGKKVGGIPVGAFLIAGIVLVLLVCCCGARKKASKERAYTTDRKPTMQMTVRRQGV